MKLNQLAILFALTISAFPVGAADQPTVSEKLKPMEWMLGRWEMTTNVADQGTFRLVTEFKPDLGGAVIVQRYELFDPSNRSVQSGIGLAHWRPEENIVASTSVATSDHGSSLLVKQADNKWIWQSSGYDSKGKFGTGLNETTKDDENTMTVHLRHGVSGGEAQRDLRFTMKRVSPSAEEPTTKFGKASNDAMPGAQLGAWSLVGMLNGEKAPENVRRLKLVTDKVWVVSISDVKTGRVEYHHGGTYTLKGNDYVEKVEFSTENLDSLVGQSFRYKLTVDGNTWTQVGVENPYSEVWQRVN
ncbi:MAG: hypothetical protein AB9869_16150 [Verrucomicrobiia bacterium]